MKPNRPFVGRGSQSKYPRGFFSLGTRKVSGHDCCCSSSLQGELMKTKKSPASSRPGKLIRRSEADIRAYAKSSAAKETSARLRARGAEPTAADMKDVPLFDGTLSRPVKAPVTVRIDLDILAWLKAKGGPYQTDMNATLRSAMLAERKRSSL
jgi:uncharacterized protein (DUF4415 family)